MDIFEQMRDAYERRAARGIFDEALERWKTAEPFFGEVDGIGDLVELCRQPADEQYAMRDRVVAALCVQAAKDETASMMLFGLFLPGLLDIASSLSEQTAMPTEDLHAELVANFWFAVRKVGPTTSRVPQRLLNNARWRTMRALGRAITWQQREEHSTDLIERLPRTSQQEPSQEADASAHEDDDWPTLLGQAVEEGIITAVEADLVVAPWGTVKEVCTRHGLDLGAARRRRLAAKARVREWVVQRSQESSDDQTA